MDPTTINPEQEFAESPLGSKEYWNSFYQNELNNFKDHGDSGLIWFGVTAETRILGFMTDEVPKEAHIADLGCGNGSLLKRLYKDGYSQLTGIDYSETAVEFARQSILSDKSETKIDFQVVDLTAPVTPATIRHKFDVVTDKGTWDAISLSPDRTRSLANYRRAVEEMFRDNTDNQFFVIISCNFTLDELKSNFTSDHLCFYRELSAEQTFTFGGRTGKTTSGAIFKFTR